MTEENKEYSVVIMLLDRIAKKQYNEKSFVTCTREIKEEILNNFSTV